MTLQQQLPFETIVVIHINAIEICLNEIEILMQQ